MYARLRRGELMALDWTEVDLERKRISVEASWDPKAGSVPLRPGRAGEPSPCRATYPRSSRRTSFVRGEGDRGSCSGGRCKSPSTRTRRGGEPRRLGGVAGLEPIGLHDSTRAATPTMIAAGRNAKAIATFMGHSSVQISYDRYGHLMPGGEEEAGERLIPIWRSRGRGVVLGPSSGMRSWFTTKTRRSARR